MITTFDIFSTAVGQLSVIFNHYSENSALRTIKPTNYVEAVFNNALKSSENITELNIASVICNNAKSESDNSPVYMAVISTDEAIVDKILCAVQYKDENGNPYEELGIGYVIGVPDIIFREGTDIDTISHVITDIFFKIAKLDKNIKYIPNAALFKNIGKKDIPMYDIEIAAYALASANVLMKHWFKRTKFCAKYTLEGAGLNPEDYANLVQVIDDYAIKIGLLRDSIYSGAFMNDLMKL